MSENITVLAGESLTGTIPFREPEYWVEPRLDLRERPIDWTLKCDAGVDGQGFESELAAYGAAVSMRGKIRPERAGRLIFHKGRWW